MPPEDSANSMQAPTLQQLNRATLLAVAGAAAILVVAVLPAEYGIDLTGLGGRFGLTPMGEMKQAEAALETAEEAAAPTAVAESAPPAAMPSASPPRAVTDTAATTSATSAPAAPAPPVAAPSVIAAAAAPAVAKPAKTEVAAVEQRGEVAITLAPNQGREVKALMKAGDSFRYEWQTDGAEVRFELHGERLGSSDAFTSYEKGVSTGQSGNFTAPFEGTHGWYWRNRTDKPVTITVKATGKYQRFAPV